MKSILYAVVVVLCVAFLPSCKEDVNPTLIVTVKDSLGAPIKNAYIITHPCYYDQNNCDTARLNKSFKRESQSDASGQATFEFPYSAVLDVISIVPVVNGPGDTTYYEGNTVVAIETKELKKDEKNEFNALIMLDLVQK